MYNEEIYQKLLQEFGEEKMPSLTDIISTLYDIKFNATSNVDSSKEYDYERQWWMDKHKELLTLKENNIC
jgi:hypothetical protein